MKRVSVALLIFLIVFSFVAAFYTPKVKALDTLILNWDDGNLGQTLTKPESWGGSGVAAIGEAVKMIDAPYTLTSISFKLWRVNSPTGDLRAAVHSITGTPDIDGKPSATGTYQSLANSTNVVDSETLTTSWQWVNFEFDGTLTLEANAYYGLTIIAATASFSSTNTVYVAYKATNETTSGNRYSSSGATNAWTAQSGDSSFRLYGVLAEKLTASNEAYTNNENGQLSTFSSYWVRTGSINASGYIFSLNYGSGYSNDTWVAFNNYTNVWANLTKVLMGSSAQLGGTIYYKTFANASNGKWYESATNSFVLQATLTFYFNSGGSIERDHTVVSNATSTTYTTATNLTLSALPQSLKGWVSWNISNGLTSSTDNSFSYSVINKTNIFCYFEDAREQALTARFNWDVANPAIDTDVVFDASSSVNGSKITYYIWFFNTTEINATIPTVTISFETSGVYEVTLTIYSEANGAVGNSKTQYITVGSIGGETEGGYSMNLLLIFIVLSLIIGLLMGVMFVRYKGGTQK